MTTLLRLLLGGLLVAAPWWWGGVTAQSHFYIGAMLVGIAIVRWIQNLLHPSSSRPEGIPLLLIVPIGWLMLGGWQLVPSGDFLALSQIQSAPLSDLIPGMVAAPEFAEVACGVRTLSPHATRLTMAHIALAMLAFWLGFDLFEEAGSRRKLSLALALNGLVITGFGIAQQLTWNGQLFWSIPLREGGSPFGPFVNRNNAAGYLLITLSCALSCFVAARYPLGLAQTNPRVFGPWRVRLAERLWLGLGHLTPDLLLSGWTVGGIAVGLFMSQSRAGALGLFVVMLALIPVLCRWRVRTLILSTAVFGLACTALVLGELTEAIGLRQGALMHLRNAMQGRVEHWLEVQCLIRDFFWTGSGWGTYPLVSPVYLTHNQGAWFQHAENQYLEIWAEAGLVGLALFLAGGGMLAVTAAKAIRSDREGRQFDSGVYGVLLVAGLSVISLTDFSLSVGSVALTFSVLAGTVCAACLPGDEASVWTLVASRRPRVRLAVGTAILLGSGMAILPIWTASDIEVALDSIPVEGPLPTLDLAACDERFSQLQALTLRDPEQSEVWAAIGNLSLFRYRRTIYDEWWKSVSDKSASESRRLWGATHPERLDAVIVEMRSAGDVQAERELLEQPRLAGNLPAALAAFDRSIRINPLQRGVLMKRAWLSHILNQPETALARDLAAFVGTSEAQTQFEVGQLSQRLGQPEVAIRSWKRCLVLSDDWSTWIWDEATMTRDEAETLTLFPRRLEPLMRILPLSKDLSVHQEILNRCESLAAEDPDVPVLSLARLQVEQSHLDQAAETYLRAIREAPYDIGLRLEASYVLERAGLQEQAMAVVGMAHNLAPERGDVTARWESLTIKGERSVENTHFAD